MQDMYREKKKVTRNVKYAKQAPGELSKQAELLKMVSAGSVCRLCPTYQGFFSGSGFALDPQEDQMANPLEVDPLAFLYLDLAVDLIPTSTPGIM